MVSLPNFMFIRKTGPKAIEASTKVTSNAAYKLATGFNQNFELATENNPEILFSLQYETGWTTDNSPTFYHTPQAFGGWGFHEPIEDLVRNLKPAIHEGLLHFQSG